MNNSDKTEFAKVMALTCEAYNKQVSQDLVKLYFECLLDYPVNFVMDGFKSYLVDTKSGSFFPKPADIVRMIKGRFESFESVLDGVSCFGDVSSLTPMQYHCWSRLDGFKFRQSSMDKARRMLQWIYDDAIELAIKGHVFESPPKTIETKEEVKQPVSDEVARANLAKIKEMIKDF